MTSQLVLNVQGKLPVGGEFLGYNGDCVEYSYMVSHTATVPSAPCNAAELNRLTKQAIDDGEAAPSGAMTNAQLAWLFTHNNATYAQTTTGDLIKLAQSVAGNKAICMGFGNGQALPGNEAGVQGHCVSVLDWDGQRFTLANGDSVNGRAGKLDHATPAQFSNAHPTQVTVSEGYMGVPAGWKDDGTTLTAPNGFVVVHGFRDYVINNAWAPGDWPLQNEEGRNPLEQSNPALGGGTRQVFRWTVLEWTSAMGVFVAWSGQELLYVEAHQGSGAALTITVDGKTVPAPYSYSLQVK